MAADLSQEPLERPDGPRQPLPGAVPDTEPLVPGSSAATPQADRDTAIGRSAQHIAPAPAQRAKT